MRVKRRCVGLRGAWPEMATFRPGFAARPDSEDTLHAGARRRSAGFRGRSTRVRRRGFRDVLECRRSARERRPEGLGATQTSDTFHRHFIQVSHRSRADFTHIS